MKHTPDFSALLIGIVLCLPGMTACNQNVSYPENFAVADSLASADPDSAVAWLASWQEEMKNAPRPVSNYYLLLCIKANDKAYITHTSDSLIKRLVDYYENDGDKRRLPEAYYYAGRVLRDMDDEPQAIIYFEKALEAASDERDMRLKSAIYSQMGTIFRNNKLTEQALILTRKACLYDIQLGDNDALTYDFSTIANIHWDRFLLDSAEFYYKAAISAIETLKNPLDINMIKTQLGHLYIDLHRYDEVEILIRPYLNHHYEFDKKYIYNIAAKYFLATQQWDSAQFYYEKGMDLGTIYMKRNAYWGLSQIALAHNNLEESKCYLTQYKLYKDSIQKLSKAQEVGQTYFKLQYERHEKENRRLKEVNDRKLKYFSVSLFILGIVIIGAASYIIMNRRKKKKTGSIEQVLAPENNSSPIYPPRADTPAHAPTIETPGESTPASLRTPSHDIADGQTENDTASQPARPSTTEQASTPALSLPELHFYLLRKSNKGMALDEQDWTVVENAARKNHPDFIDKLAEVYPCSTIELKVCLLVKLKVAPVNIALFTGQSKENVSSIRRRLYKKVFGEKGSSKQWDAFIHSL